MKYNGFRVGVFYKNEGWAKDWISEFFDEYSSILVKYEQIFSVPNKIIMEGDIRIDILPAEPNFRGIRYDKVFVENGVDQEFIDSIIMPMLSTPRLIVE